MTAEDEFAGCLAGNLRAASRTVSRFYDDALRKEWTRACKKSGVRYRKPYVLRHTAALWLQMAGLPRAQVADIMGHADYGMLDKVYGRWQHGIEADAERITAYLGVKKSPPTNP